MVVSNKFLKLSRQKKFWRIDTLACVMYKRLNLCERARKQITKTVKTVIMKKAVCASVLETLFLARLVQVFCIFSKIAPTVCLSNDEYANALTIGACRGCLFIRENRENQGKHFRVT